MAFYNSEGEDRRESEYNELALKMKRIHGIQSKLHLYWENPKGIWYNQNVLDGGAEYGFVLISNNLENLYYEVEPKCNDEEKKQVDKYLEEIEKEIDKGQEAICKKIQYYDKQRYIPSNEKWNLLKKQLRKLQNYLGELLQAHGYNPDKSEDEGL